MELKRDGMKTSCVILGMLFVMSASGCLATRGWVTQQLSPLAGRMSEVEGRVAELDTRLNNTNARVDDIETRFDRLQLERHFVLNLKEGVNFGLDSAVLSEEARHQIDGFLSDLERTQALVFLVAGHTDSSGSEEYNYELGQKRAANVARYLVTHRGIDPFRVTPMSYGENAPLASNMTPEGRQTNRRIEILVYKEAIASSSGELSPRVEADEQHRSGVE